MPRAASESCGKADVAAGAVAPVVWSGASGMGRRQRRIVSASSASAPTNTRSTAWPAAHSPTAEVFSVGGSRRRYFPVAAAAKALLVMYGAPGDRATEMMYPTRLHAAVAARGRVGADARLAAERHDTSA